MLLALSCCRRPSPPSITKVDASGPGSAIVFTVTPPAVAGGVSNLTFSLTGVPVGGGANITRTAAGFTSTQAGPAALLPSRLIAQLGACCPACRCANH